VRCSADLSAKELKKIIQRAKEQVFPAPCPLFKPSLYHFITRPADTMNALQLMLIGIKFFSLTWSFATLPGQSEIVSWFFIGAISWTAYWRSIYK